MADKRVTDAKSINASAGRALDRVFMHDLVLDVEIGVYTHEKGVTQRVRFSVDVDVLPATGALDDNIARAFDYDTIIKGIKDIIAEGHINLVETLAERIAEHCLQHPRASSVLVRIEKLDKEPGAVGVEIVRAKEGASP
jgi:dihydroneopterin aldolase